MSVDLHLSDDALDLIVDRVVERLAYTTDPWLTVDQAADYLGCSRQRIYDLVASKAITVGKDGRRVLVRLSELDHYLTKTDGEAK